MHRTRAPLLCTLALAVAAPACHHKPDAKTPEGTLALLRDSLVTGQPPVQQVADLRIMIESQTLQELGDIGERLGHGVPPGALALRLANGQPQMTAEGRFAGVATMLRQGHCEKLADGALPMEIRRAPPPGEHWAPDALALQASVARRLTNAFAADYRCDGGPSFRAAFVHSEPDDGTWRVAWVGPSGVP